MKKKNAFVCLWQVKKKSVIVDVISKLLSFFMKLNCRFSGSGYPNPKSDFRSFELSFSDEGNVFMRNG
jgi:hypothetical protein